MDFDNKTNETPVLIEAQTYEQIDHKDPLVINFYDYIRFQLEKFVK